MGSLTIADARARIALAATLSGQYVTQARRHSWVGMGDGAQTCARPGCGISRFVGWEGETAMWEYQDAAGNMLAREWKLHPVGAFPKCRGQVARRRTPRRRWTRRAAQ